jgi:hypothetical protein
LAALGVENYHGVLPTQLRLSAETVMARASGEAGGDAADPAGPLRTRYLLTLLYVTQLVVAFDDGGVGMVRAGAVPVLLRLLSQEHHAKLATRAARALESIMEISSDVDDVLVSADILGGVLKLLDREVQRSGVPEPPRGEPPVTASEAEGSSSASNNAHTDNADTHPPDGTGTPSDGTPRPPPPASSADAAPEVAAPAAPPSPPPQQPITPDSKSLMKMLFRLVLAMARRAAFATGFRNAMEGAFLRNVAAVLRHVDAFGLSIWYYAATWVTDFVHAEPNLLPVVQEAGVQRAVLETLQREVPPSADIISNLPTLLAALALNDAGLRSFTQARPLDALMPIFLSSKHLNAMSNDTANLLGSSIDELWRHQPSLRQDGVAAICSLVDKLMALCSRQDIVVVIGTDPSLRRAEKLEKQGKEAAETAATAAAEALSTDTLDTASREFAVMRLTNAAAANRPHHPAVDALLSQDGAARADNTAAGPMDDDDDSGDRRGRRMVDDDDDEEDEEDAAVAGPRGQARAAARARLPGSAADSGYTPGPQSADASTTDNVALFDYITNTCRFIESLLHSSNSSDHNKALLDAGLLSKLLRLFRQTAAPARQFLASHARVVLLQAIDALLEHCDESTELAARTVLEAEQDSADVQRLLKLDTRDILADTLSDAALRGLMELGGAASVARLALRRPSRQPLADGRTPPPSTKPEFWEPSGLGGSSLQVMMRLSRAVAVRMRAVARVMVPLDLRAKHARTNPAALFAVLPADMSAAALQAGASPEAKQELAAKASAALVEDGQRLRHLRDINDALSSVRQTVDEFLASKLHNVARTLPPPSRSEVVAHARAANTVRTALVADLRSALVDQPFTFSSLTQLATVASLCRTHALSLRADLPHPGALGMSERTPNEDFVSAFHRAGGFDAVFQGLELLGNALGEPCPSDEEQNSFPRAVHAQSGEAASPPPMHLGVFEWNPELAAIVDVHAFPLRLQDANIVHALSGGAWRCDMCSDAHGSRDVWHSTGSNYDLCYSCFQRAAASSIQRAFADAVEEVILLASVIVSPALAQVVEGHKPADPAFSPADEAKKMTPADFVQARARIGQVLRGLWMHQALPQALPQIIDALCSCTHAYFQSEHFSRKMASKKLTDASAERQTTTRAAALLDAVQRLHQMCEKGPLGAEVSQQAKQLISRWFEADASGDGERAMGADEERLAEPGLLDMLFSGAAGAREPGGRGLGAAMVVQAEAAMAAAAARGREPVPPAPEPTTADPDMLQMLQDMGFEADLARGALVRTRNNLEAAADAILRGTVDPMPAPREEEVGAGSTGEAGSAQTTETGEAMTEVDASAVGVTAEEATAGAEDEDDAMLHQALLLSLGQEEGGSSSSAGDVAAASATDTTTPAAPESHPNVTENLKAVLAEAEWSGSKAKRVPIAVRRAMWHMAESQPGLKEDLLVIFGPCPSEDEETDAFRALKDAREHARRITDEFLEILPQACVKVREDVFSRV